MKISMIVTAGLTLAALFIVIIGALTYWGIRDLTYAGDPERIEHITAKVAEYAAGIAPEQTPEVNTWYFGKAHHYISEFTLVDSASGQTMAYACSWPADSEAVDLDTICSGRAMEVNE